MFAHQALEASIKHWEQNVAATDCDVIITASGECALCDLYVTDCCAGCPIAEKYGIACAETPYHNAVVRTRANDFDGAHVACEQMLELLKGLRTK